MLTSIVETSRDLLLNVKGVLVLYWLASEVHPVEAINEIIISLIKTRQILNVVFYFYFLGLNIGVLIIISYSSLLCTLL